MPIALLLAMQAAGMVVDFMGSRSQQKFMNMGAKVEQAGIEANLQQTRLESEDASLQAMRRLRQDLGSQIATFGARGTRSGAGNAAVSMFSSLGTFQEDERMRRLNLLGREASIKAGKSISKLNQQASNAKLWNNFASRSLSTLASSGKAWGQIGKDISSEGFGLTKLFS